MIADKLGFQLAEIVEPSRTIDEIRIGDGVCCAGEKICQADLIPNICRNDNQGRIEESRDFL